MIQLRRAAEEDEERRNGQTRDLQRGFSKVEAIQKMYKVGLTITYGGKRLGASSVHRQGLPARSSR